MKFDVKRPRDAPVLLCRDDNIHAMIHGRPIAVPGERHYLICHCGIVTAEKLPRHSGNGGLVDCICEHSWT